MGSIKLTIAQSNVLDSVCSGYTSLSSYRTGPALALLALDLVTMQPDGQGGVWIQATPSGRILATELSDDYVPEAVA